MILVIFFKGGDILRAFITGDELYDTNNLIMSSYECALNYFMPRFGPFIILVILLVLNFKYTRTTRRPQDQRVNNE